MPDLIKRLIKIARAEAAEVLQKYGKKLGPEDPVDEGIKDDCPGKTYRSDGQSSSGQGQNFSGEKASAYEPPWPAQVVEDLNTFGLKPPSSLEEVKKARNAGIRKYHPDRFLDDPSKLETSKKIMQIYNTAYERLEKWFSGRSL